MGDTERLKAILLPIIQEQSQGEWDDKTVAEDVQLFLPPLLAALQEAEKRGAERMRERAAAEVEASAAIVDHPSVFMGGPSRNAQRIANSFANHVRALPLTEDTRDGE